MKDKFDTNLTFLTISLSLRVYLIIDDSIASYSLYGIWEVDKDKLKILVMTDNSGPMHSFCSHVGIGSNE